MTGVTNTTAVGVTNTTGSVFGGPTGNVLSVPQRWIAAGRGRDPDAQSYDSHRFLEVVSPSSTPDSLLLGHGAVAGPSGWQPPHAPSGAALPSSCTKSEYRTELDKICPISPYRLDNGVMHWDHGDSALEWGSTPEEFKQRILDESSPEDRAWLDALELSAFEWGRAHQEAQAGTLKHWSSVQIVLMSPSQVATLLSPAPEEDEDVETGFQLPGMSTGLSRVVMVGLALSMLMIPAIDPRRPAKNAADPAIRDAETARAQAAQKFMSVLIEQGFPDQLKAALTRFEREWDSAASSPDQRLRNRERLSAAEVKARQRADFQAEDAKCDQHLTCTELGHGASENAMPTLSEPDASEPTPFIDKIVEPLRAAQVFMRDFEKRVLQAGARLEGEPTVASAQWAVELSIVPQTNYPRLVGAQAAQELFGVASVPKPPQSLIQHDERGATSTSMPQSAGEPVEITPIQGGAGSVAAAEALSAASAAARLEAPGSGILKSLRQWLGGASRPPEVVNSEQAGTTEHDLSDPDENTVLPTTAADDSGSNTLNDGADQNVVERDGADAGVGDRKLVRRSVDHECDPMDPSSRTSSFCRPGLHRNVAPPRHVGNASSALPVTASAIAQNPALSPERLQHGLLKLHRFVVALERRTHIIPTRQDESVVTQPRDYHAQPDLFGDFSALESLKRSHLGMTDFEWKTFRVFVNIMQRIRTIVVPNGNHHNLIENYYDNALNARHAKTILDILIVQVQKRIESMGGGQNSVTNTLSTQASTKAGKWCSGRH